MIAKQLELLAGVQELRVNPHAGSITVYYNPTQITQTDLLASLEKAGCLTMSRSDSETAGQMGEMFGKALFGAVVQKTVERSVQSLVGVFL
jgi:copper chaperone CopZ